MNMVETPVAVESGSFPPLPEFGKVPMPPGPGTTTRDGPVDGSANWEPPEEVQTPAARDGREARESRASGPSPEQHGSPASRVDSGIESHIESRIESLWGERDRDDATSVWDDDIDPFDQVIPLFSPEAVFSLPLSADSASVLNDAGRDFRLAMEQPPDATLNLPSLAGQIGATLDASMEEAHLLRSMQASPSGQSLQFEFSMELPDMGPLTGRMLIGKGKAELELQAHRPSTAAALRAQAQQLRQLVQKDSDGDVELWVL